MRALIVPYRRHGTIAGCFRSVTTARLDAEGPSRAQNEQYQQYERCRPAYPGGAERAKPKVTRFISVIDLIIAWLIAPFYRGGSFANST
jgi:hypothetical protein